jgi:hypothetical protein
MKCHGKGNGEEKTLVCSPLMRLALSQREDIIKKTDLCQFCYEQKKGSACLSASEREGHICKDSGDPNRHTSAKHQNPIQVHHLGFRWVVNNAGKLKPRGDTAETTKSVKMAEMVLPPSDSVRRLMDADSALEDEYTLKAEVMDLDTTIEISDEDSLEEGEIRDDPDEDMQFIEEVILVPSDSESDLDSEPETEQSSVESDEESEEPYDSYEEDSGNDSTHSGSHFDSDDESINPDNDYRKMLTLGQTVTLFDHQVNICYDSSSTVSILSADVHIPGVVQ